MAANNQNVEASLAWSFGLFMAVIATWGATWVSAYSGHPFPGTVAAAQAVSTVYALLGLGLAGAMGEPLPPNPRNGYVPWRLRFCWGILGWCPPPGVWPRTLLGAAAGLLFLYPFSDLGPVSLGLAASLPLAAFFVRKPADSLSLSLTDMWLLFATAGVGLGALGQAGGDTAAEAWRGVGVLAALALFAGQRAREVCALRWAQLLPGIPPPPALDLSRYELSVEKKALADRPAMPEGAEAQLVDSGSFRVDAAKMLDKLRQYQLADPEDFVCAWLRCAAASGARAIELDTDWTSLTLVFDGRPFSAGELSAPYQALADGEGENARRGRHFAYGLLGLYRLRPRGVSVTSRGADGVAAMNAGRGQAPDPETAPQGTVIRVSWPAWAFFWRPALLARRARERFGLGTATLTVDGMRVPKAPSEDSGKVLADEGWYFVLLARRPASRVRVYVLGTFIEELEDAAKAPVEAWLAHDGLELDISQSAVVRGELLDAGLRKLDQRWLAGK